MRKGDEKMPYYKVDYSKGGAFTLNKKGRRFVTVTYFTGVTTKLTPPLDESFNIEKNNVDDEAKCVSSTSIQETPLLALFKKANLFHHIHEPLSDTRVGQASPSPTKQEMLALCDGAAEASAAASNAPAPALEDRRTDDVPRGNPHGSAEAPRKRRKVSGLP